MKHNKNNRQKNKPVQKKSGFQKRPPAKQRLHASLWGVHAVYAALKNQQRTIKTLYITEQASISLQESGIRVPENTKIVDKNTLDNGLPPGAVHQGIALDCSPLEEVSVQDLIISSTSQNKTVLVMLDQVTDPHNVGAILRSSCAFGAGGLIMQKKHAPELTGVLAKTACGAVEHVPVAYETNLTRTLETLQENGFFAIGLDERGEQHLHELDIPDKCVLVLGAEGPGLRRLVREQCDFLVKLPTSGPISSLNVSNAAAVSLCQISVK